MVKETVVYPSLGILLSDNMYELLIYNHLQGTILIAKKKKKKKTNPKVVHTL